MSNSEVRRMIIFIWMVVGENHSRASNTLEILESIVCLVILSVNLGMDTVSVKESILVSHEISNVLEMTVPESVMDKISLDSLISGGIESSTRASLEFHLWRWKNA